MTRLKQDTKLQTQTPTMICKNYYGVEKFHFNVLHLSISAQTYQLIKIIIYLSPNLNEYKTMINGKDLIIYIITT